MEHLVYASIILVCIAVSFYLWTNEHRTLRKVTREKEEIEIEEHRMFDFLHGLGEELLEDTSPARMHRYIVSGVTQVVDAHAGILYLFDAEQNQLVPMAQSKETAPILPLPDDLVGKEDDSNTLGRYRAFIRLTPQPVGEGLVGGTLNSEDNVIAVIDLADFIDSSQPSVYHKGVSALSAPLIYANKTIGALVVTRGGDTPFNDNDRDVFASVTEQSSYALGSAIIHAEAHEKRRLERELAQASEIQRILLPKKNPDLDNFSLAATYRPARHVSGDYYDYVRIDEDHFGVAIADVCGKGIAASLIMAMCRSSLRSVSQGNASPRAVLHGVNQSIFPDIREDMFVSFLYLVLERHSDQITISNAGHEPPLIRRAGSTDIEEPEVPGMAVGVDKGPVFNRIVKEHQLSLSQGDVMLLYTDGLIEALSTEGEEYGFERFQQAFSDAPASSAQAILDFILADIDDFASGAQATDDITLIAIEKR